MKKLTPLLLGFIILSCQQEKQSETILTGKLEEASTEEAQLIGANYEDTLRIENGGFSDTLQIPNNGFYDLYFTDSGLTLYLEKGKTLSFSGSEMDLINTATFEGDLAKENTLLLQRELWKREFIHYPTLFEQDETAFIENLDANKKELNELYASSEIKNKDFKKALTQEDDVERAWLIESYADAHRVYGGDMTYQVDPEFYSTHSTMNFKDTTAYRSSLSYQKLVNTHFMRVVNEKSPYGSSDFSLGYMNKIDEEFPEGFAKNHLTYNFLNNWFSADKNMTQVYERFKTINTNDEYIKAISQKYESLKHLLPGNPSPTFHYENYKGGKTGLEDLKGKYVYIDVWATWCGPCIREIPSLKEIEKDYNRDNFQVVSISIDAAADFDKWREMVANKELGGIQLMADENWNSQFVKDYGIMGIPRFILLDTDGNIINADAPRPSDPELRVVLDDLL